jgi:hypothetical protein
MADAADDRTPQSLRDVARAPASALSSETGQRMTRSINPARSIVPERSGVAPQS